MIQPLPVYAFVDGAYLMKMAEEYVKTPYVDPRQMVWNYLNASTYSLERLYFYDASPEDGQSVDEKRKRYWERIEQLEDTHLGFGYLREKARKLPRKQKAVDTLLAVHMLVNAFHKNYAIAVLVAGDTDFVPVVQEVQRLGRRVFLLCSEDSESGELRSAVDRRSIINYQTAKMYLYPWDII